jgi:hypothetical protein
MNPRIFCRTIALGLLTACASTTTVALPDDFLVELDVYSGRPNPEFSPPAAARDPIRERLEDLPRVVGGQPLDGGLGYRGFALRAPGERVRRVYVGGGLIVVYGDAGAPDIYRDVHGLEDQLIRLARANGWKGPPLP